MGDRISVQFKNGKDASVVLFSHWRGMGLVDAARRYAESLCKTRTGGMNPLDRKECGVVMVDFIRHLTKGMDVVDSDLQLHASQDADDNGDNGHYVIEFTAGNNVGVRRG